MSSKQFPSLVDLGSAVRNAHNGKAIDHVLEGQAKDLVSMLKVLQERWGQVTKAG